jgi:peroxin-5
MRDVGFELRQLYERQDVLIDAFVEAAQTSPDNVDPEVQVCLGLLYSLAQEYDNAAMCFQAALSKKPEDYALWNKLGATLANSGRSQEALQAYFQALERKPLYVRARANLGISFLAMKMYVDAAKQFLAALSIEPDAVHIWTNLESAFSYMQRRDLVARANDRDVGAFRKEFDF